MTDTTSPPALPNEPQPSEIERLTLAMREALTDSMVERLSVTSANALEVVDRLNDDETRAAVHSVIDQISELHRIGALQTLFDFVALFHAARSAATDNIVVLPTYPWYGLGEARKNISAVRSYYGKY